MTQEVSVAPLMATPRAGAIATACVRIAKALDSCPVGQDIPRLYKPRSHHRYQKSSCVIFMNHLNPGCIFITFSFRILFNIINLSRCAQKSHKVLQPKFYFQFCFPTSMLHFSPFRPLSQKYQDYTTHDEVSLCVFFYFLFFMSVFSLQNFTSQFPQFCSLFKLMTRIKQCEQLAAVANLTM